MYTPAATVDAEKSFLAQAIRFAPPVPIDAPISLKIVLLMPIPKSLVSTKAKRQMMDAGMVVPTSKPDADNAAKLVMDAMNGIFYRDDKLVYRLEVIKVYGVAPGIGISLWWEENGT
jgi:Holliday junction resolvase RusA-like endonuclease